MPGHGPVTTKNYLDVQRSNLLDWVGAVAAAVAKGWTREETIERVHFRRPLPRRRRPGIHDGPHPDPQRGLALRQDDQLARDTGFGKFFLGPRRSGARSRRASS